jgi:hypothetical protein
MTGPRTREPRAQSYRPPNKLSMPVPHDPDIVFRYVRVSLRGLDDASNWKTKRADGWEPVRAEEYPEFMGPSHELDSSRFAGCIGTGDLVLMQNHRLNADARSRYYAEQTEAQMAGVDNDLMRGEDPRMPIFSERKTRNQVVGPRKVSFDD